ncbi:MAG: glycosyltransferase family 4 protein [Armatimonadetes bacterium]|nr:glycosyltransferase family 4 protein [Armatimonadota bacterium]
MPMTVAVITLSSIANSRPGYYNLQDLGLALGLAELGHKVILFRALLLPDADTQRFRELGGEVRPLAQLTIGSHVVFSPGAKLPKTLDGIIMYSDRQLMVSTVNQWAAKHGIPLINYVGTLGNVEEGGFRGWILKRTLETYRKAVVAVKTPAVGQQLQQLGVKSEVVPVGLNIDTLTPFQGSVEDARTACGLLPNSKVLGFVGALVPRKNPVGFVEMVNEVRKQDSSWQGLIVGDGEVRASVDERIEALGLGEDISILPSLKNREMWRAYHAMDVFVNLSVEEIFGMAILEAMHYEVPVVAAHAPGPDFIIRDGLDGLLVEPRQERYLAAITEAFVRKQELGSHAKQRIEESFTVRASAERFVAMLNSRRG